MNNNFNSQHFYLYLYSQPEIDVSILKFTGKNDAISHDYSFEISVRSQQYITPHSIISTKAKLYWDSRNINTYNIRHGIITSVMFSGKIKNNYYYELILHSPLYPLTLQITHRIFQQKNVIDIVREVLTTAGWSSDTFQFQIDNVYPLIEFLTQFKQSDYAFIDNLITQYGLITFFDQQKDNVTLIITDNRNFLHRSEIITIDSKSSSQLIENTPYIYCIYEQTRFLTENVMLDAYDYYQPEADLIAVETNQTDIPGAGTLSIYDQNYQNKTTGAFYCKKMQQQLDWQRQIYIAESNYQSFAPGQIIQIKSDEEIMSNYYQIIAINHQLSPTNNCHKPDLSYNNQLTLIPITHEYFTPSYWCHSVKQRNNHQRNTFQGLMTSQITNTQQTIYGAIDEFGFYNLQLPFVYELPTPSPTSRPTRQIQACGGNTNDTDHNGWHFPLAENCCVAITFMNDDLNRPIILGALQIQKTPNVVTESNYFQNIIQTWGGQKMILDDSQDMNSIQLSTTNSDNNIKINNNAENPLIKFQALQGQIRFHAKFNINQYAQHNISTQSTQNHVITVMQNQQLIAAENIGVNTGKNINLSAKQNILLTCQNQNIQISTEHLWTVQSINKINIEILSGNLAMVIHSGNFDFYGHGFNAICNGQGAISLSSNNAYLNIDSMHNINFHAIKIELNAPLINLGKKCQFNKIIKNPSPVTA